MKNFKECEQDKFARIAQYRDIRATRITKSSKYVFRSSVYAHFEDLNFENCWLFYNFFAEDVKKVFYHDYYDEWGVRWFLKPHCTEEDFAQAFDSIAKRVVPGFKRLVVKIGNKLHVLQELGGTILTDTKKLQELPVDFKLG